MALPIALNYFIAISHTISSVSNENAEKKSGERKRQENQKSPNQGQLNEMPRQGNENPPIDLKYNTNEKKKKDQNENEKRG
ncbi:hypothetical protein NTE_00158 [Candidatus Nitrososphaera evergladensis SR1]|uniref:Uncharacterized protein n=1 Tax=Candidatus Nitrososphaera evergladensis SR1 TaxID=1459636 RepID=A0A075MM98_9ARCH|nr:hypothetical protein [Candidatus Nitrososphaera evergladensis]AIF82240.1 hypothetical protein NTE_00158 [Candidatus Nitrososphaera evergladensis SR1]